MILNKIFDYTKDGLIVSYGKYKGTKLEYLRDEYLFWCLTQDRQIVSDYAYDQIYKELESRKKIRKHDPKYKS